MKHPFLLLSLLVLFGQVVGQVTLFEDVSSQAGFSEYPGGRGLSVADFDGDGWEDVFVVSSSEDNKLMKNMGDGTFQNVIQGSGIYDFGFTYCSVWGDIDNDGDLDLFVGNFYIQSLPFSNMLYLNDGDGTFTNITFTSGVGTDDQTRSALMADVDNDGYTDIYVCNMNEQNVLWHNNGDGTFSDYTITSGATDDLVAMGAIFFDYDNDRDLDLYLTHDADQANILYQNDGSGVFTDVSVESGLGIAGQGMGVDQGDFNNDGWLDVYVTNLGHNFLFLNGQDGTFAEVSGTSGVGDTGMGWGCFFTDHDNDGWEDIYVVNDHNFIATPNRLYHNNADGTFNSISEGTILESTNQGFGGTWCDFDKDGRQDIMIANQSDTCVQLLRNTDFANEWIGFEVVGTICARDAYGARVTVVSGEMSRIQEKLSASSYSSQSSHRLLFGLGDTQAIDQVIVHWPDGTDQEFGPLTLGHYHTLTQDGVATSIDDSDLERTSMFPNPVSDIIQISTSAKAYRLLEVFDTSGNEIVRLDLTPSDTEVDVDLTDFATGTYILRLSGSKGSSTIHRIVKH